MGRSKEHRQAERLSQFEAICRRHGLPVTVQRRAVFEALLGREDHPTAEEVLTDVRERLPEVSRTTVYRVLDKLASIGVIRRVSSPGSSVRFDALMRRHHHLICRSCDRITDIESPKLDEAVRPEEFGLAEHEIEDYSVYLYGTCETCRKRRGGTGRTRASAGEHRGQDRPTRHSDQS